MRPKGSFAVVLFRNESYQVEIFLKSESFQTLLDFRHFVRERYKVCQDKEQVPWQSTLLISSCGELEIPLLYN